MIGGTTLVGGGAALLEPPPGALVLTEIIGRSSKPQKEYAGYR